MKRNWLMPARILTGMLMLAGFALPQAYTISAKPGAVSHIEGVVEVNEAPVVPSALRAMFLGANDTLSTTAGKAEVLLVPGVFMRVGDDTKVRMIAPSLVDTQVELLSGEMMIEVDQAVPGTTIAVMDHGSSTTLTKTGLYRFSADTPPTAAVLEGKADVYFGDKKIELKKGKEVLLTEELTISKVDLDKADELYAWSNVRAQYDAAVSYQGARAVYDQGGYGYASGYQSSGLYWNNPYNSWMWMPGNGAFYSPFGWGFYGPGVVAYAPVVGYGGGYGGGIYRPVNSPLLPPLLPHPPLRPHPPLVPVNPKAPGVANLNAVSPAAFQTARAQLRQSMQSSGTQFHTATGAAAASLASGRTYANPQAAVRAASSSASTARSSSYSGGSSSGGGGGWHASSSSPSRSGGFSGSGHSSGSGGGAHSSK
jgi:hypothetical protein